MELPYYHHQFEAGQACRGRQTPAPRTKRAASMRALHRHAAFEPALEGTEEKK